MTKQGNAGGGEVSEQKVKELESLRNAFLKNTTNVQDLEKIYNYITEGIILRSKADKYEQGEKSPKCFLNLEKRNKAKSHTRMILTENSSERTDSKAILSELKSFYSNLYEQRSTETKAQLSSLY